MIFIKRFLFILFFSIIYCYIGYQLFSDIFYSDSVIITYGIHPFNICTKNSDLWKYIKITFFITYIFSSFIISNFLYFIISLFLKKLINLITKILNKLKSTFNSLHLFQLFNPKKLIHFIYYVFCKFKINKNNLQKKIKNKNTFFSDDRNDEKNSNYYFQNYKNNNFENDQNDSFNTSINHAKNKNQINSIYFQNKKINKLIKKSDNKLIKNNLLKKDLYLFVGNTFDEKKPIYLPEKSLYQNILITGTIGTGKTSSAMYPFTKQLIEYSCRDFINKIGMLVLDVKGNYHLKVSEFAKNCGRENDLVIISLGGKYKYNPLHKPNLKPSILANRLKTILLLFSPNNSESYWLDKSEQILTECIKLCRLYNNGYVTFEEIHKLISVNNYYTEKIEILRNKFTNNEFSNEDIYNLISSLNFFQKEFLSLDSRTLSILKSEITRITNVFVSDYEIYKTFNPKEEELNFFGFEDLINTGKIVVLNMNISEYKNLSKIIATYLKLDFQAEVMARLANNFEFSTRTVAFISDEYHEYCTVSDSEFYAQSREAKCINIVASQSYTSLLNSLNNKYSVEVIVQNLVNKFWFRTDDIFTIENAQKQIGKEDKEKLLKSISENAKETNYSYITNTLNSTDSSISESISKQLYFEFIYDTKFFTQELENFCALAFISDGNKIIKPEKIKLKPYFEK